METWIIFTKLILFVYLIFSLSNHPGLPWIVLALLIYFCLNLVLYIVTKEVVKRVVHGLSLALTILASLWIDPLIILLFPMNIYELGFDRLRKKWMLVVVAWIPETFIEKPLHMTYGLISLLCFIIFLMGAITTKKLMRLEHQSDDLRKAVQRLSKSLNENKEYMRQSEYTFKLEERNRLSQEIHDKIGHSMTGALIQMEAAKAIANTDKKQAYDLLQNAINISKSGIEEIRQTLKNMKPPSEQMGINRVRLLIDEFSSKHPIHTAFTYKGNLDVVTPIQWKVILENVGESLTNLLKYAEATAVSIDLTVLNKVVKVDVKDNGKGALKIKKGLGISGMEERTASLNGKIIVDGSNGFSVTTLLPVSDEESHIKK
ncbi:sensor histidine kinase [Pullulanibacillus sp. KACC 23026]|uniref:sensor histidine kinase n=1 Tax=Pullulanibacillus sp. KACC 23026 TaxID=3028315 RepID=UPI0023B18FA8|nr:sensor histidine kinase [Pullulanibacillus sp. KACC 23026]WEG11057.1 sensor histidine kinase [Pullulanibacillus sp. KACC 23026]